MPVHRLVVVCHKYPPYASGGLAPYVARSLQAIRANRPGSEITLYTMDYPAGLPRADRRPDGLLVRRPRMPRVLQRRMLRPDGNFGRAGRLVFAAALALFNLAVVSSLAAGRRRYDLITVHDWQSTPAGLLASVLLRSRVIYHVHNTEMTMTTDGVNYGFTGLIAWCERAMSARAECVVVPSPEMREVLASRGWARERIEVVPHGFEEPALDDYRASPARERRDAVAQLRSTLAISAQERVVVYVGRLSRVKGIHTLLDAMPAVLACHPHVRLVALGVGFPGTDESPSVHRHVRSLGLTGHVYVYDRYLDAVSVARHYELADVCAFPSTFEPFGLVSIEAMSFERPVILGRGFSSVIGTGRDGPTALRMATDTSAELAALINDVLDDPSRASRLARRGREHVETELTWNRSVQRALAAYDAVTDRKVAPRC